MDKINDKKKEVEKLILCVATLEAELQGDVDYAREPQDNNGNAINDLEDRERVLKFLHENTAMTICDGREMLGIFWHYSNVLSICDHYDLECPGWFIDKYCAHQQ